MTRRLLIGTALGAVGLFVVTAGLVFGLLAFVAAYDEDECPNLALWHDT